MRHHKALFVFGLALILGACTGDVSSSSDSGAGRGGGGGGGGGGGDSQPSAPPVVPPGGTSMQLSITSPARGATLQGDPAVTVTGQVTGQVSSLSVNGAAVTPAADGQFSHVVQASHGMNLLIVQAESDEGVTEKLVQSFYHSTKWLQPSPADPASAMIDDAVVGWLGQPVFDSQSASAVDFASIVERTLASLDVAALVPKNQRIKNVAGCDHADIEIKSFRYDPPRVSIEVNAGELLVKVTLTGLEAKVDADLDGPWYNPACAIGVSGKVKASSVEVTARVGAAVVGSQLRVEVKQTAAQVDGFDIDISGVWGFLTNWLVNMFEDDLARDLEDLIKGELDDQLGSLLSKGIADLAFDQEITSKPLIGPGPPVVVEVVSRLDEFALEQGGVRYAMDATAVTQPVIEHASLGSIARDSCGAGTGAPLVFGEVAQHPLQLAVSDDLVNQLLHGVHQGGLLRASVTQQDFAEELAKAGISEFEGTVDALLPPIFNTCTPDGRALLQLGDLRLQVKFQLIGMPVEMQVHLGLEVPVEMEVRDLTEGQRIFLSLGQVSRFEVESRDMSDGQSTVYDTVRRLLETQLVPLLLESLQDQSTSFAIPAIDLSEMHSSIPAGTTITLQLARVEQRDGYTVVVGGIR